jgi:hypothetical protein
MLCNYSEIFGKVGEGVHSYRMFDIAIVDVISTLIGAYFLQTYFFRKYTFLQVVISLFLLGIILHRLFCVRTTVDKLLFD